MKFRIGVLLILGFFMLGCSTTIYKPSIGFKRFDISNLDKDQYSIRRISGSAEVGYFLIFPISPVTYPWEQIKRGYLFPFNFLYWGHVEQKALYDALEYSGCDVVLSFTKITGIKGIPGLLWWKKVDISGKGVTLKTE